MMDAARFKSRITATLARYGEDVTVGETVMKAFLQALDSYHTHLYLDDTEALAVVKPGLFMVAAGDAVIAVNNTMTRNGRIYTVRKIAVERLGNTPVLTFAVLS